MDERWQRQARDGHDEPVARNLGDATAAASASGGLPTASDVPPALRGQRPAWRDPRLWIGIVLVAASVVVGARVLAAADDTVQVWAAARDLGAGQRVEADDLVAQRVRFADADALEGYFTVDDELPADLELTRSVAAGELLPQGSGRYAGRDRPGRGARRRRARARPAQRRARRRGRRLRRRADQRRRQAGQAASRRPTDRRWPVRPSSTPPSWRRRSAPAASASSSSPCPRRTRRRSSPSWPATTPRASPWSGADEGRPAARGRRGLGDPGARPAQRPARPRRPQALRRRRRPARHGDVRPGRHRGGRARGARASTWRRSTTCVKHGVRAVAVVGPTSAARSGPAGSACAPRSPTTTSRRCPEAITTDHQPAPEPPPEPPDDPRAEPAGG